MLNLRNRRGRQQQELISFFSNSSSPLVLFVSFSAIAIITASNLARRLKWHDLKKEKNVLPISLEQSNHMLLRQLHLSKFKLIHFYHFSSPSSLSMNHWRCWLLDYRNLINLTPLFVSL